VKAPAAFVASALAFGVLTTSAAAKEIKSAKVCGPSECVSLTDREEAALLLGGEETGPPAASSFYTVEFTVDVESEPTWTVYYVPSAARTRPAYEPDGEAGPSLHVWSALTPGAAALFREVTRGLEPFPKPELSSVVVGSKTVTGGADSYLRLFELPPESGDGGVLAYSQGIDLRSAQPTPWTDKPSDLSYSPSAGLLARGGQLVRIPKELLADMGAGRPLAEDDNGEPFAWQTLAAVLAAAVGATVAFALLLRHVRRPPPPIAATSGRRGFQDVTAAPHNARRHPLRDATGRTR
jgi:hypothetical protein